MLFKKKNNIRGGKDIRIINILPTWLVILEKLAYVKIKQILEPKIPNFQFGFKEGSDCNLAKTLTWFNSMKLGLKKQLLIDIQKAFDSINRNKLKEMVSKDFDEVDKTIINRFIELYDNIQHNVLGKYIYPTKGGPQGSSLIPLLFSYYIENAIKNCLLKIPFKMQLYADDIIIQAKTIEELSDIYHCLKAELEKINLTINTEK